MTPTLSLTGVTRRYRDQLALDDVSFEIEGASIMGLLGRNGAGKTTLMRIIAAQEFASAGGVRVLGQSPLESEAVLQRLVLVREDQRFPALRVRHVLQAASWFHPNWSAEFAAALLVDFDLPLNRMVSGLSRGMHSALGIVIGLACRAEVTLFDEPYAGLDAVARQIFYDRLLADFAEHPRTVIVSTHLIDEAADLLERVLVIDRGRIVLDATADDLRGAATRVSGPAPAVDEFVAGRKIWDRRSAGSQASVVVAGALVDDDRAKARQLNLTLASMSLQQLVAHAPGQATEALKEDARP
ncbi:MAG: ABC transporter ATP-binding protein [Candidatus Dormiibacterota bacterium]